MYVALCPELDIASQGQTVETARTNLIEALELFFESADPTEVALRLHSEVFVTRVEVAVERRRLPEDRHVPDPVRGPPWLERSDDGVAERNGSATSSPRTCLQRVTPCETVLPNQSD